MKRMILLYSLLAICLACGGTAEDSEEQWESDSPAPSSAELNEDEELVESIGPECGTVDTVCVSLQIPESVTETPEKLIIGLYESLPPMGPPDVFPPFSADEPKITPGGTLEVILDAEATGTYQVYTALYMPGGGLLSWRPESGVDYVGTSAPITLNGDGLTLTDPIPLVLVQ